MDKWQGACQPPMCLAGRIPKPFHRMLDKIADCPRTVPTVIRTGPDSRRGVRDVTEAALAPDTVKRHSR